jgi:hypothetical protein
VPAKFFDLLAIRVRNIGRPNTEISEREKEEMRERGGEGEEREREGKERGLTNL